MTASLEAMLARGSDGAMLRFTLASRYLECGELERALAHAEVAVKLDADYSAAWRLLGKIQEAGGSRELAAESFGRGIAVAEQRGDRQAAKEMRVFLRRLEVDRK
jgi:Tfp pilus assembly protein PilF